MSDPDAVGSALGASDIGLWELSLSGERTLTLSESLFHWVPELGRIEREEQLLALMSPADQYLFRKTFNANRDHSGPAACEVCLAGLASQPRLRFIGCRQGEPGNAGAFVGAVVSSRHWLANPGPEYVQSLLSRLFADSPIASLVTDPDGVMLEHNQALEQLLELTPRQATEAVGRYRITRDRALRERPELLQRVRRVFQRGDILAFDMEYPLAHLHRNQLYRDQRVPVRLSFLPMRDRFGEVTRVLVQCQDRSDEHSAHRELQHRDRLLYNVIDNSRNLVSIKSVDGSYLLVNDRFARWSGADSEEICGKTDAELFPAAAVARMRSQERSVLEHGTSSEMEEVLVAPDGREHTFVCVRFPIEDTNGDISAIGQILTDITRQKSIEHRLQYQQQELRLLLDSLRASVCYFDRWGLVKDYNVVAREEFGAALGEGRSFMEVAPNWDSPAERQRELMQVVRSGEGQSNSIESACQGPSRCWYSVDKIPTKNNQGFVNGVLLVVNDITERKEYEEQLEYQATHDALTRLPNRTRLYREIESWLDDPGDRIAALLLIDLDRFKEINDTLGHQAGDQLLSQIGPRLHSEMGETPGLIARLGGDEFAIFLPSVRHHRQALVFGHRVLDALRNAFTVEGYTTEISASVGISIAPDQAGSVSNLMRYADIAMYRAKSDMTGVALYDVERDPHSPKRLFLMNELGRAIREGQLRLHFQPKIELAHQRCYGLEALLRWQHPSLGMVSPAEFIPIAEATNLIHPLTHWVLEESIAACCRWHEAGCPLSVAVNLSARNLLDDALPRQVEALLRDTGLPHWALELEITESSIMTDPRRAMANLNRLSGLGVGLSIDDFGTGYSSLAYLKRLPVRTLKIDQSFVRQMLDDEQDEIIVNSTIHLAHNLGLSVVAEGVESGALLSRLRAMGCDLAQGFYMGRPISAEATERWLRESAWLERPTLVD